MTYEQHPDIASRTKPTEEAIALASDFCSSLNVETVTITAEVRLLPIIVSV